VLVGEIGEAGDLGPERVHPGGLPEALLDRDAQAGPAERHSTSAPDNGSNKAVLVRSSFDMTVR
jgi:hypothetical protein